MIKILITGGAGFVGSSLAHSLLKDKNNFVVLVDSLLTGHERNIPKENNCVFIKCNVNNYRDISSVMERYGFDYVFHYAAVVGVQRTINNPKLVLDDICGMENIFMLSKNTGVKRIFFSSSSEVYGEPVHLPQHEHTTPLNSKLPYAVIKNLGECFCRTYKQEYGLNYTILRFFNTYGPKQSDDFVITRFLNCALKNEPILIYGDGSQTRTFCYVQDNVDFTIDVLKNNHFINDVVNVGSDQLFTIKEIAEIIIKLTKSKSTIDYLPPLNEGDMTRRQPDISKMRSVFNRDFTDLATGIENIIKFWKLPG